MPKIRRKRRASQRQKSPTIVSPSRNRVESTSLDSGIAKLHPDRAVMTSREILIEAPAKFCFDTLSQQLEQPPRWDPMIFNAWPTSDVRYQPGAESQIILNLGGKKLSSRASVCRYQPNRAMSWVLGKGPKVREDWRLASKPRGTMVRLTIAQELKGRFIEPLIYKIMRRSRLEQDLDKTLAQLKKTVESSISSDQRSVTNGHRVWG